jgi:hypothetical protein
MTDLPREAEENLERLQLGQCAGRKSNGEVPEYEPRLLLLYQSLRSLNGAPYDNVWKWRYNSTYS